MAGDLLTHVTLLEKAHDALIKALEVSLDQLEFTFFNKSDVRDWITLAKDEVASLLHAAVLECKLHLADGLGRKTLKEGHTLEEFLDLVALPFGVLV